MITREEFERRSRGTQSPPVKNPIAAHGQLSGCSRSNTRFLPKRLLVGRGLSLKE